MPFTSIAEFRATESPTRAEEALIKACQAGQPCILGDGRLPPRGIPTPSRHIRADLLRLLIIGGTANCGLHPSGVWLKGGHVTETLDLRFTQTLGQCALETCRFEEILNFAQTRCAQLALTSSHIPGIFAQCIVVEGNIFLRGLTAEGNVNLNGAKIGVQLDCEWATIIGSGGEALDLQNAEIGADLLLRNITSFGTVALNGAKIGGQLEFDSAMLNGMGGMALNGQGVEVRNDLFLRNTTTKGRVTLSGAKIGGQFNCSQASLDGMGGDALNAQRLHVAKGFVFRELKEVKGLVYLYAAHVSDLVDDTTSSLDAPHELSISGLTYDNIALGPHTFAARKDWLARGSRFNDTFHPQPYTQFAKVLREMGHASEARKTLMERDRLLFAESHKTNLAALNAARIGDGSDVGMAWLLYHRLRFWDWFSFIASGYGHAPQRALFWSLRCVAFGAVWFFLAWCFGVMVPNSAIIITSPDWLTAMATNPNHPSAAWTILAPGQHYETFYALPYALDVFVPFLSLGQESAWAATTVGWLGWATRMFTFLYQITGWAITALGIAAITGFVQKNQPD